MTQPLEYHLTDHEATEAFGKRLALWTKQQSSQAFDQALHVHLVGDLGAGKSTLARAWLRALGVQGTIRSPTYTLVELYDTDIGQIAHLDLYRLHDAEELEFMDFDDLCSASSLLLIEWPQRAEQALPPADVVIELQQTQTPQSGRMLLLQLEKTYARTWFASE